MKQAVATFGGGCFWCLEAAFEQLRGVISVLPGYMGGDDPAPTYDKVCGGRTGHANVIDNYSYLLQIALFSFADELGAFLCSQAEL